ncbi:MAG: helix-turn-helix domain-containing protein [Robiginitomaculum sp.]|nr:helix-turn-helix domain-containing protein [Robiginitomaculum sp.]
MDNIGDQIRSARKEKGWTQTDLAKKIGVSFTTVAAWEQGKNEPKLPSLVMLTNVLKTKFQFSDPVVELRDEFWGITSDDYIGLDYSDGEKPKNPMVPVVGYVGAGGSISPIDDHANGGGLDEIEVPPETVKHTVAVIVRGDSMRPMFTDGMILYYSKREKNIADYLHKVVIAHFVDERKAIKTLTLGSKKGVFTLTSFNAAPMKDVKLESVSPIDWIKYS